MNEGTGPRASGGDRREAQRFEHLVLGKHRPKRSGGRRSKRRPVRLAADIEEAVARRERWSHKAGTPETHEHVARRGETAIHRMWQSGAIDGAQKDAAEAIETAAMLIGRDVTVRTASLETRVDATRRGDGAFREALGRVRLEVCYSAWRSGLRGSASLVLDVILFGKSLSEAARTHRMHKRRASRLLIAALDLWLAEMGRARKAVDPASLASAHAVILS